MNDNEFTHVIYHSADLDGHCSGAQLLLENPDAVPVPWDYGQAIPEIPDGSRVALADLSFPRAAMEDFVKRMARFVWIDHHRTAIAEMAGLEIEGLRDTRWAACELTWLWLQRITSPVEPTPNRDREAESSRTYSSMPYAVWLLGRWDVWDHAADPDVAPFQYGMRAKETDLRTEAGRRTWQRMLPSDRYVIEVCAEGRLLRAAEEKRNQIIAEAACFETTFITPGGAAYDAIAFNSPLAGSRPGELAATEKHHLIVRFGWRAEGYWSWSLYRNPMCTEVVLVDCGAMAKEFGGGGHVGAAGFRLAAGKTWPLEGVLP